MIKRAGFMLSYDKPNPPDWPFNTVAVPRMSAEPSVGLSAFLSTDVPPVAEITPTDMQVNGKLESSSARASFDQDGSLQVTSDDSAFADQFSVPIAVKKNTDYVIAVSSALIEGRAALKVTSSDRRIALASSIMNAESNQPSRKRRRSKQRVSDSQPLISMAAVQLAFASGNRTELRLVVSNNGTADERPIINVGEVRVFELGTTAYLWSRYPRAIIRGAQRNLFTTMRLLPCVLLGILLLALARRQRELSILLSVPLYYLCVQSALHTEYRYILAIHYFLFILAGTTLYYAFQVVWQAALRFLPSR
jgi:hypothetical protein